MLRASAVLLRRGKPPVKRTNLPGTSIGTPPSHRPFQGGQQTFGDFLLRSRNDDIRVKKMALGNSGAEGPMVAVDDLLHARSPMADFAANRLATDEVIARELQELVDNDGFTTTRGYNDAQWYENEKKAVLDAKLGRNPEAASAAPSQPDGTLLPQRIADNDYFKNQFGYSLVKDTTLPVTMEYGQLDMWAELPQYGRHLYFLYVISRRRNTYSVCYDYDGKRMLAPYSAGNKGLKGGDKGFRSEGGPEVAHQVTSMYLNDVIAKIREHAAVSGRPMAKTDRVEVVLRVLGFYNGRSGAVRAVNDRKDFFNVRYFEDVTPMPSPYGNKMPRAYHR